MDHSSILASSDRREIRGPDDYVTVGAGSCDCGALFTESYQAAYHYPLCGQRIEFVRTATLRWDKAS